MELQELLKLDPKLTLIPAVGVLVKLIRETGVPSRYLPWISSALGIAAGFAFFGGFTLQAGLVGLLLGAAMSGLYDLKQPFQA